jgi:hypothetical protein
MYNTVSWCITDIFEYVIKYHNSTTTYSKVYDVRKKLSLASRTSTLSLKPAGESTQETNGIACNDVTT